MNELPGSKSEENNERSYFSGSRVGDQDEYINECEECKPSVLREGDHEGEYRTHTCLRSVVHNEKQDNQTVSRSGDEKKSYNMPFPALSMKTSIEEVKERPKWQISKEKIEYIEEKDWRSQNVQLDTVMGRNWLRRTMEEGIIISDCYRLTTGGKEEVAIDQDKIVKIMEDAAKKGGIELKIIRGEGNRREERILNSGVSDSMKLVYFQENSTIKIKRKIIPEGAGEISYKEIVETGSEKKQVGNQEEHKDRQTVTIIEGDNQRLCWVLKMHSEKRMNKNPDMSHSPTDLDGQEGNLKP